MLTPEQIDQIRTKSGLKPLNKNANTVGKFDYLKESGLLPDIKNDLGKRVESIKSSITKNKGGGGMRESLNIAGQAAGGVLDVVKRVGASAFDKSTTELSKHISGAPSQMEQNINQTGLDLLESPVGKEAIAAIKMGVEYYDAFKKKNPGAARDIENIINIAEVLPIVKGVSSLGTEAVKLTENVAGKITENIAKPVIKKAGEVVSDVKTTAKGLASKAANSEFVSPIEPAVKNELLKSNLSELNKYAEVAKAGALDYSKPSALDVVGDVANKTLSTLKVKMKAIGEAKSHITDSLGHIETGKIVYETRQELRGLMQERAGATFNKAGGVVSAAGRSIKISEPEANFLKFVENKLASISTNFNKPSFRKVDDVIDAIQGELYAQKSNLSIPSKSNIDSIVEKITSNLNDKLKAIGGTAYQSKNAEYAAIKPIFDDLNKMLGKGGKNGGAIMKRIFSPSDAGTKKLFNKIKELTGVDLIKEATLAKYAMEKIGDARSASLLEQMRMLVGGGKAGMIEKAANFVLEKSKDPIKQAQKYLKK